MSELERVDIIVFQARYEMVYDTWSHIVDDLGVQDCLRFKEIYDQFKIQWAEFRPWQRNKLTLLRELMMSLNEDINQQLLSLGNVSSSEQSYTPDDSTDDGTWD